MTYPFGVDISSYQYSQDGKTKPNFDLINEKCDFVAVRAGISWGYTDRFFAYSWQHLDVPRLAYHVIYPGEWALKQVDHFLSIVQPEASDRLVLDMELDHGYSKARITDTLLECVELLLENTGRYPVIYSRASWINQFVDVSRLPKLDWWLAGYLKPLPNPFYTKEATPPPALPTGVDSWLIHQTAEKGNGSAVGVVSHYVDCNRFNGTQDELLAYFGLGEETPEPEPPVEVEDKLFDAKVVTTPPNRLKTRYTPNGNVRPEADWLQSQAIVPVYETHSTGWWRVAPEAWSSATWMERVDDLPLPPPMSGNYAYYGAVYSQRDVRWKDHPLGTKSTIGANGCLMTCASMVCNHFGHASNPLQLNQWLTDNEGYLDDNLFLWAAIERLYPDMRFDGFVYSPTAQQIKAVILAGVMPIMHVDFDDSTPLIEMHWVTGIGVTNTDVLIADPWTGTIGKLSEMYPKNVIRYGSYRRQA